jgi:hypothetical protein
MICGLAETNRGRSWIHGDGGRRGAGEVSVCSTDRYILRGDSGARDRRISCAASVCRTRCESQSLLDRLKRGMVWETYHWIIKCPPLSFELHTHRVPLIGYVWRPLGVVFCFSAGELAASGRRSCRYRGGEDGRLGWTARYVVCLLAERGRLRCFSTCINAC